MTAVLVDLRMTAWMELAACASVDPALFFPTPGGATMAANAKRICAGCPVKAACLAWALDLEGNAEPVARPGIFGGLTPAQRWALARGRAAS